MGKKRRQSKRERDAKRNRALEREVLGGSVSSARSENSVEPVINPVDTVIESPVNDTDPVNSFEIEKISGSRIEDVSGDENDSLRGNNVDVRVMPMISVDSLDPVTPIVRVEESPVVDSAEDVEVDRADTKEVALDESKVDTSQFDKGSLYGNTFGSIWPDEPNRHRRVSVWAFVSGALLTIATLGVLFGGLTGEGGSEKGRTIVSRPGEHRVADTDFVFKGRSVKVEIVGGMVTQTSEKGLVKKVASVIERNRAEWKSGTFKMTDSISREMTVTLMDGKTTEGMFEVYVDYDKTSVILLSDSGYIELPDGVGKQIFNDLSKAGKYKD